MAHGLGGHLKGPSPQPDEIGVNDDLEICITRQKHGPSRSRYRDLHLWRFNVLERISFGHVLYGYGHLEHCFLERCARYEG